MKARIFYNDESASEKYNDLKNSSDLKDLRILKEIDKAIDNLEKNPFSGVQIPKRLIPKSYNKIFEPDNLWKYNLNNSWRLIYWISSDEDGCITLLIDWMNHKEYERLFGYNSSQ